LVRRSYSTLIVLLDASEKNKWKAVPQNEPLISVLNGLSADSDCHRIAITDDKQSVIGLVSQSTAIEFLNDALLHFPDLAQTSIKSWLGRGSNTDLVTVKSTDKVLDAFQAITTKVPMVGLLINLAESDWTSSCERGKYACWVYQCFRYKEVYCRVSFF
jgi:hypothetical protein